MRTLPTHPTHAITFFHFLTLFLSFSLIELDGLGRSKIKASFFLFQQALGTPVQTAVKRADEQAFAALNGRNLMFVEDAARRIQAALEGSYAQPRVHVRHMESLHPHDAVAWA